MIQDLTQDQLDKVWKQQFDDHVAKNGRVNLGGVNPPSVADAAAGTMKPEVQTSAEDDSKSQAKALANAEADAEEKRAANPGMDSPGQMASNTTKAAGEQISAPAAPRRPPADFSSPLGWRPPAAPPVDTELRGLQDEAARRRGIAGIGNAISEFQAQPNYAADFAKHLGGGGSSPAPVKSSLWDNYANEGEQPLKDLQDRRKADAALLAQQTAAQGNAEDSDPNSPKSNLLRATLSKYSPELAAQLVGKSFKEMQPIAGPELSAMIASQGASEREKNKPDPHAQAEADKKANTESLRQALKSPAYASTLKASGTSPDMIDSMGDEGLKALQARFEHTEQNKATVAAGAAGQYRADAIKKADAAEAAAKAEPSIDAASLAVAEGRAPYPTRQTPNAEEIIKRATALNPKLDATTFATHQHVRESQSTDSHRIAVDLAFDHIKELRAAVDAAKADISKYPLVNDLKQGSARALGNDTYKRVRNAAARVAAEVTNAYGEKNLEGERISRELLSPNQSPEQWAASIDETERLLRGKQKAFADTAEATAPTTTMIDPDGDIHQVSAGDVEAAKRKGLKPHG